MRKVGWFSLALMTAAALLVLAPAVIAILTSIEPWPAYIAILILTTAMAVISLPTRMIWPRTEAPYYFLGVAMFFNIIPYAAQNGSPWGVWGMGMSYLIAGFLTQKIDWGLRPRKEPGFDEAEERWIVFSAIRSALGSMARFASVFMISIVMLLVLPWLRLSSVELWTIAALAVIVLFTLTFLSAADG